MNPITFDYSTKNIPLPTKKLYLSCLIEKVELIIKRMRWKALLYEKIPDDSGKNKTFGFKSRKCPPQHKDLIAFENDLLEMIRKVTFTNVQNDFQNKLRSDLSTITKSSKAFIFTDKTRNMYELDKQSYDKLLSENITKTYKKTNHSTYNNIHKEAKIIASRLNIDGRVECMAKSEAFISLKDHKEDFNINPKCRLINPAKSEIGKVSKNYWKI